MANIFRVMAPSYIAVFLLFMGTMPILTFAPMLLAHFEVRHETITTPDLLRLCYRRYFGFMGVLFSVGVLATLSALACFFPAIYVGLGIFLAPAIFKIEQRGVVDAIKASWALMNGRKMNAFLAFLAWMALVLVGSCFIGILGGAEAVVAGLKPPTVVVIAITVVLAIVNAAFGGVSNTIQPLMSYVIYAKARRDNPDESITVLSAAAR